MSYRSSSSPGSVSSHRGNSLASTIHSEVAPCLPLSSLPVFCGASCEQLRLFDESSQNSFWSLNRTEVLAQSSRIADLLRDTDVSYLNLRQDAKEVPYGFVESLQLHDEVLHCHSEAFDYNTRVYRVLSRSRFLAALQLKRSPLRPVCLVQVMLKKTMLQLKIISLTAFLIVKSRAKRKGPDEKSSVALNPAECQEATIQSFCESVEDFCNRAEINDDDREEVEWQSMPVSDIRMIVNEIMCFRAKGLLHLVPVDILVRLLRILDHQIHRAEGLTIDECEHSDSDVVSSIFCGLESIHTALAIMAHNQMPKQLHNEEIIERILEFSRHQIMDVMCAYDPSYRALSRPSDNCAFEVEEDEKHDFEGALASKKRPSNKTVKVKRSASNKVSAAVNNILQKMCTIIGLFKEYLLIEKLSDSCILQMVKTSFTTFLVDNIQILQLKAIGLISGIFYAYTQHRTYVMDELLQLLWKLPFSKRALRAYHLPDEEQKQIQMVTALLIQLVHSSANIPETLRQAQTSNPMLEVPLDANYPIKCHNAVTVACCLFWTGILQRLASSKTQDSSELKVIIKNIVSDLLTTLSLPEYPASAPILEVLCVLLMQNAGLKSKDISARSMAIDILGPIATRLKRDTVLCRKNTLWILQDLVSGDGNENHQKDACSICFDRRVDNFIICQGCRRLFQVDCLGVREQEAPNKSWHYQICLCKKQLLVLQSYGKSQDKGDVKNVKNKSRMLYENYRMIWSYDFFLFIDFTKYNKSTKYIKLSINSCVQLWTTVYGHFVGIHGLLSIDSYEHLFMDNYLQLNRIWTATVYN